MKVLHSRKIVFIVRLLIVVAHNSDSYCGFSLCCLSETSAIPTAKPHVNFLTLMLLEVVSLCLV